MRVNLTDGIEIVIDDDLLLSWQQSSDKKHVSIAMNEASKCVKYEIDLEKKEVKRYGE